MTRPDPVRALPQADWKPPVVADPDPPDDPERGIAPAGNPPPRPGPANPAAVGPSQVRPDVVPFSRWLSPLVRLMRSKAVRFGFLAIVLALLGVALTEQAGTLWHQVSRLSVPVVLLAFLLLPLRAVLQPHGLAGIARRSRLTAVNPRGRADHVHRAAREIRARQHLAGARPVGARRRPWHSPQQVRRIRAGELCRDELLGLVVAMVTLPFATAGSIAQYFWILFLLPVAAVLLSPPVLNRLLRLVLRVSRQPVMEQTVSYRGLARTMVWALFGWSSNGLMVYVLMRQLAGHPQGSLLVSVGAYSLSWAVGFLAVFAPAGAGVREAVMVAVLGTRTTPAYCPDRGAAMPGALGRG